MHPNEIIDSNWSKKEKHVLSPNIVYTIDVFNRLSRLFSFFILCHPKVNLVHERYEIVVFLAAALLRMNNFNSSYSVYLSLQNIWIKNYVDIKGI